jgi:hypothetical protein
MEEESHNFVEAVEHPLSLRWAVFEDDGVSGWLYLTEPRQMRPVADCWIYNRIEDIAASAFSITPGSPPPACTEFIIPGAQYARRDSPEVAFEWTLDGEGVAVRINGTPVGFIAPGTAKGYSRFLAMESPWGKPWDAELFARLFPRD